MQIIIPLLQGITGLHGGGCQGANGWLDSPLCPPPPPDLSETRYYPCAPVWQEWPGASDPVPCIGGTRRPNLKAASQWQGSAPLEATQWGQVITAAPFKESSSQCCCLSPLDHTWHRALLMPAEHFYQHFTSLREAKGLGKAKLLLPRNLALLLLINVYSQHQIH